jgi:hypothetical protein
MKRYFLESVRAMAVFVLAGVLLTCDKNEGGGWYSKCSSNDDCNEDLQCDDIPSRLGEDFCTKTCSSSSDCQEWFGPGAACESAGHCFKYCENDSDCPGDSNCDNGHDCQIR